MAEPSDLVDWLERLEQRHPREIDLGLTRIARVADRLGLRPFPAPVLTVAGTNGKGTVTHCAAALARAAGRRVGAYTSPHLLRFNERIAIDGIPAGDAAIVRAFEAIEAARGTISLSYFETATLAALWLFRDAAVELAVLEVGLGGRLDATNILDADVAVITRIGLDHREWLGDTVEAIAIEKAGIARRDRPVILGERDYPASMDAALAAAGARSLRAGRDWHWVCSGGELTVTTARGCRLDVPLADALEPGNVAAAVCAVDSLIPLAPGAVAEALRAVSVPGRRERRALGAGELWLDVAHNPDAAAGLADALARAPAGATHGLCAIMEDKDLAGIFAPLAGRLDSLVVCDLPGNGRAASVEKLAAAAAAAGVTRVLRAGDLDTGWRALAPRIAG
ncbi:bifunctional folylpolyglutamate synthase/dihydrofolate synthase, partial [Pseudohaliea rubra]|uniref:bifunctional folylpolyglutamate synthase/dihydrofolate synthase n=1 Tax=Pseudohaliea rubra TaxID=475795 RepID=UPI00068924AA